MKIYGLCLDKLEFSDDTWSISRPLEKLAKSVRLGDHDDAPTVYEAYSLLNRVNRPHQRVNFFTWLQEDAEIIELEGIFDFLAIAIRQIEKIPIIHIDEHAEDGFHSYLALENLPPWDMPESEKKISEDDFKLMLVKYIAIIGKAEFVGSETHDWYIEE